MWLHVSQINSIDDSGVIVNKLVNISVNHLMNTAPGVDSDPEYTVVLSSNPKIRWPISDCLDMLLPNTWMSFQYIYIYIYRCCLNRIVIPIKQIRRHNLPIFMMGSLDLEGRYLCWAGFLCVIWYLGFNHRCWNDIICTERKAYQMSSSNNQMLLNI